MSKRKKSSANGSGTVFDYVVDNSDAKGVKKSVKTEYLFRYVKVVKEDLDGGICIPGTNVYLKRSRCMVSRDSLGGVISSYLVKLLNVDVKPLLFLSEKMLRIMERDESFSRGDYDVLKNPKKGFGFIVFESNVVLFELIDKEKDLCALVIIKYNSRMFSVIKHLMIDEVEKDFPIEDRVIEPRKRRWGIF